MVAAGRETQRVEVLLQARDAEVEQPKASEASTKEALMPLQVRALTERQSVRWWLEKHVVTYSFRCARGFRCFSRERS